MELTAAAAAAAAAAADGSESGASASAGAYDIKTHMLAVFVGIHVWYALTASACPQFAGHTQ